MDGPFLYTPDEVVVRVSGDDALTWLNGQVTNDVLTLEPGQAAYALVVSVKGKVLTDLWVYRTSDEALISLPAPQVDTILSHFDRFIIMEDVELTTTDLRPLCFSGAGPSPSDAFPVSRLEDGWDLLRPQPELEAEIRSQVAAGAHRLDDEEFERRRIAAGIPRFGTDFGEGHYPQEAGLKGRAVSFTKGCYTGQEVVCMLESRGKLRRRLARLAFDAAASPQPGTALLCEGAEVGSLTSVHPDGLALGYVKASSFGRKLETDGGTPIRIVGAVGDSSLT